MNQDQVFKILKYLLIIWLVISVVFGTAYIALAFLVIEIFDQIGSQLGPIVK